MQYSSQAFFCKKFCSPRTPIFHAVFQIYVAQ
jgi:hypothetical protein